MGPMRSIPTKYAGVQFRSRLEARWAAFFDLVRWPWEYEPIDLAGYIPDFVLGFDRPLLVEVKPIVKWPCMVVGCNDPACTHDTEVDAAIAKIRRAGWSHEAVLVGASPKRSLVGEICVGVFAIEDLGVVENISHGDASFIRCGACGRISFCSATQSYHCRACGVNEHVGRTDDHASIIQAWREAGNRVQWRPAPCPRVESAAAPVQTPEVQLLAIANDGLSTDEYPGAYCWRCGFPTGADALAEIDYAASQDAQFGGYEVRHVDRDQCDRNVIENGAPPGDEGAPPG